MNLRNLMIVNAVLWAINGIGFVLAPAPLLSVLGVTADQYVTWMTQAFGAALIGYAIMNWFARNDTDSEARRAILLANLGFNAIGVVIDLLATLSGVLNALGWSIVALHLLLALAFAYFQFMKRGAA